MPFRQDVQLLEKVQKKYFAKCAETVNEDDADAGVAPLIEAVVSGDWRGVAERCDPSRNWKEALAAALTYAYHDPEVSIQIIYISLLVVGVGGGQSSAC